MRWPCWQKYFPLAYSSATFPSVPILYCMTFEQTPVEWIVAGWEEGSMLEMLGAVISVAVIDKAIHASGCSWHSVVRCPGMKGAPSMKSAALN